ncbi:putative protein Mb2734 [Fibrisoma limi BUZ 3]|uniref:AB hydrolase-1 domain-containing protein n=1 Tax=Fibrisoma limi BUZ 3 TaxID=1185876 RepID=I2GG46_9BACT|nr:alpha/beta hydrolase [Fibrisoma limi]CCH52871.1 putative protein Mb2734 [Fibrisoma limi BUZ 3]
MQSGYAEVNGLRMYYEVQGEGAPIVLIHGSFGTSNDLGKLASLLAKSRKVIMPEMQGHARTADIPRELSYEAMADDVAGLLKQLNVEKADVLGYSMGGGVAFQMGIRHPEQVGKLVVLSGVYKHDGWWPEAEAAFPTLSADLLKDTPIKTQYDSLSPHPDKFDAFIRKTISIDLTPYDWTTDVEQIANPIYMVIGDADGVRYEHALELICMKGGGKMGDSGDMPESRMAILPGTTHTGMPERAEWLAPMINEFLDAKTATGR